MTPVNDQNAPDSLDELKKQKEKLDAEKALLDAEKAKLDSERALAEAKKTLEDTTSNSARKLKELGDQKAIADAQKALSDAQMQSALTKLIGDVKAGPYSGGVEMQPNAGTEEALVLAAHAVNEAAGIVATAVYEALKTLPSKPTIVYIFAAKEFPNFQRLLNYRFRKEMVRQAFFAAGVAKREEESDALAAPALVSAGLDAFSKILGFFRSDSTIGRTEVKLDESLLLFSVAGKLFAKQLEVHLPLVYEPTAQQNAIEQLGKEVADLVDLRSRAAAELRKMSDQMSMLQRGASEVEKPDAGAENPADPKKPNREALLREVTSLKAKTDQLTDVIALYDAFANSLTTPDTNGNVPVSFLVQEYAVDAALKAGNGVLLLRLENTGGGYLVKKNLLTGLFGSMPLYHMGGATVSYLLLAGDRGKILAGDALPIHGGFVRTDKLRETLNGNKR
ncbi:MAG: hypothetical protein JO189_02005 [Deltaproteobacteria bacterium]|nr:hypothetical protein [Deltaproteobacteria bacterium]